MLSEFGGNARLVLTLPFFKSRAARVYHELPSPRIDGCWGVIAPMRLLLSILVVGAPTQRRSPDQAYPGGRGLHIA